jgi:hypothetical protein
MIGGLLSLLWLVVALALAMVRSTPRISLFAEIDFASKVARKSPNEPLHTESPLSFQTLLSGLSDADSSQIRRKLGPSTFFVRPVDSNIEGNRPLSMMTEEGSGVYHNS